MTGLLQRLRELLAPIAARPRVQTVGPLVFYALFTIVWIGRGVVLHPTTEILGNGTRDTSILMWSFKWWPHAIAHGLDPFAANVVWAPHGVDLAWVTSSPALSFVLSPLTETLGPVFSYNFAALAAPPLAAWTSYLLARRLTRNVPASLVAGFLFGFSPYLMGQSVGHLNLSFVCLVPLAGLLAVRFFDGSLGRWRFTALLALVLVLQFGISTEIFATLTLFAVICFVLATFLLDSRTYLLALAEYTALAYCAVGVVVSPYLIHAFETSAPPVRPLSSLHTLDLANVFFPTETTWLRPPHSSAVTSGFFGGIAELDGYVGLPLLVIFVLAVWMQRRGRGRRGLWLLALAALAAEVLAVGPEVTVGGHRLMPGVWALFQHLPALGEAIPIRFVMYSALFAALAAALWLAQPGRRLWHVALAGVAVVCFLPTPSGAFWASHVSEPRFFATPIYRQYIRPGDTALVLPYVARQSWSMLWQAQTNFRFSMMGGHVGQTIIPAECNWADDWESFDGGTPIGGGAGFRAFLLAHHVNVIVEGPATETWSRWLIEAALPDVRPVDVAGVRIYRVPPDLPFLLPRGGRVLPQTPLNDVAQAVCGQ